MTDHARRAGELLGRSAREVLRLHGGDLSDPLALKLADGATVVVKPGETARAEAEMLRAIGATGAPAPEVLAASEDLLVMEFLPDDGALGNAWASLGRAVRQLHDARGTDYGWHRDHRFGAVAIPNGAAETWPGFWAERRLLACASFVEAGFAPRLEKLAYRLDGLLPKTPVPALLHGDLWTGNVLASGGQITGLIDPACCYGHAEVDLAMLSLFGTPGPDFRASYGEAEPGFAARQPVYQLWPALVHLRLFGAGYAGMVDRLLREAGV
jgi:fructosamine-3-kinase